MAETPLFDEKNIFVWTDIETFFIRSQYNEMLRFVVDEYTSQYDDYPDPNSDPPNENQSVLPNFLNNNFCLTIRPCRPEIPSEQGDKGVKAPTLSPNKGTTEYKNLNSYWYNCEDKEDDNWFVMPVFTYKRAFSLPANKDLPHLPDLPPLPPKPNDKEKNLLSFKLDIGSLTVGAVIWLYFYERMGIFKILGALLDDYNYRGKYTITGLRGQQYSRLMDKICTLHRAGISSNLRDRICLYQRVLGVSIENNLGIESERNTGFMNTFNRLIDYMLEYYKAKQLAQAIQAQAGTVQPRSSVATQTSIRDTIKVLQQHFETFQYGRNMINTFLGIATVHATLCLVRMLKSEIGIPVQYNTPEEFIPAAYDILVAKRSHSVKEANRFIIYDDCASYGYRLLTDIERIQINMLQAVATGSVLDSWLNDIEGLVEGYRNAYSAVPEKVEAIV